MKKEWQTPWLEVLNVSKTLAGPGMRIDDEWNDDTDPEEHDHFS